MTRATNQLAAAWRRAQRPAAANLLRDECGVAAVELAVLAPLIIAVITGLYATERLVRIKFLLNLTAYNMTKMVATQQTMTAGVLHDFCSGAQLTMAPYDQTALSMSVASYTRKNGTAVTQDWENLNACPTTASSAGSAGIALATQFLAPNGVPNSAISSTIIVTASYKYKAFGQQFYTYTPLPDMTLTSQPAPGLPRYNATITCANC